VLALKRGGEPEEIVDPIVWLASAGRRRYVAGMLVDGGCIRRL
jgi:NAD(P)-dependent dehydrogenase (short-subunit alcohol dehydrogenase family)